MVISRYWGDNSIQQQAFIARQKHLFATPTMSQYGLLVFAAVTIAVCAIIPDWLYNALS
ncbi:solute:Na+ symporter%2C SSS family protein [Vibrio cholerae]|nr:solute:Na+ symporter%2C SSS family protein [Vibrio cholerae]